MQSVAIIGIGRVGGAFAIALGKSGFLVSKLFDRNGKNLDRITELISPVPRILDPEHLSEIDEDIVFITTQDTEIDDVVQKLSAQLSNKPKFVFHTSGSRSSDILQPLSELGINIGSIHPLAAISDPVTGVQRLKNAFFCVEGNVDAKEAGESIVAILGGRPFSIETKDKILYHASAVMASGHFVALMDIATSILARCGLKRENAKDILLPLIESTIENIRGQAFEDALTGTFARADIVTLIEHIDSLSANVSTDELNVYLQLGKRSLELAESKGADKTTLESMHQIIADAQKLR